MFSEPNFFFVSGSAQIFAIGALALAAIVSFLASNHSLVTGGMLAIFLLRLYLCIAAMSHHFGDLRHTRDVPMCIRLL